MKLPGQLLGLVISLPTENATARMRAWRALKTSGAAVLRDGVYLLPDEEAHRATLETIAADVNTAGGVAHLLDISGGNTLSPALFNRDADYAGLLVEIRQAQTALNVNTATEVLKQTRKWRKTLAQIGAIDFFPGEAQRQTGAALDTLVDAIHRLLSPDEPLPVALAVQQWQLAEVQGKTWATRHRPWVDRLACAWLIKRCIDPQATILWLASPADCPAHALGFDFDGATFTHTGTLVSFENLLASFRLQTPALSRLAAIVHFLDVGGLQPAEAEGIEQLLAGLRHAIADDDELLAAASTVFDGLLEAFTHHSPTTPKR